MSSTGARLLCTASNAHSINVKHAQFNSSSYITFLCSITGAGRSGGSAGATGQGADLEGSGRWSQKHHDTQCGPNPGPRRKAGRPHGQVRGPASRGQSFQRSLSFYFEVFHGLCKCVK